MGFVRRGGGRRRKERDKIQDVEWEITADYPLSLCRV
jgi:hypothetical protein